MKRGKNKKPRIPVMSKQRKYEIAVYCVKHQHLSHKERAYYLGLKYGTYMDVFHEMIAVYSIFIIRDEAILDFTEKSLEQTYIDTCFEK